MPPIGKRLAMRLKQLRERRGLTQKQLAKALKVTVAELVE